MCTFQSNQAAMFNCADVLFQVNGTSAQCCVVTKQTWKTTHHVTVL